ncbi:MAG: hypothetical protein V4622_00915 [Bacteroidota bacterium]
MKKKSIVLTISIVVLGFLAFMATNLVRNSGKSDTELLEFSIADTSSIDKIILTDAFANKFELKRVKGSQWTDANGNCVIQQPIATILETFKNVEFKGYVPENSRKNITNRMSTSHTKVEIFQHGEWVKTWFVGFSTQDHYGTYMLLETPDEKSDLPVIMKIKGFNGIIEPRFFSDPRRWKCTEIFSLERDEIASVDVKFYDDPTRSFSVTKSGSNYAVKHQKTLLSAVDTNMIIRYLNNYKKIHFEFVNYDLTDKQVDSVKRSKPFCVLTLKETVGNSNTLKMYRMKGNGEINTNDFGDSVSYDPDRFWCVLPSGELVKCQYFVFDPLIMGHIYFATRPEQIEL